MQQLKPCLENTCENTAFQKQKGKLGVVVKKKKKRHLIVWKYMSEDGSQRYYIFIKDGINIANF